MQRSLALSIAAVVLIATQGCSPQSGDTTPAISLPGSTWQVEDIDQGGIIDSSHVTLEFVDADRIAGSTGCNRYFGKVDIELGSIAISGVGSTRRACAPALMSQEQRFLTALNVVSRYEMEADTWLLMLDDAGTQRLELIEIEVDPTIEDADAPVHQDGAVATSTPFACEGVGTVAVRFLGPETVELSLDGRSSVLQRVRTASGARYQGDGLDFWNKGSEASLIVNGETYRCQTQL
jgi:heat shock protein HslJ/membrane-bound inhibitor of C-type lysozyme